MPTLLEQITQVQAGFPVQQKPVMPGTKPQPKTGKSKLPQEAQSKPPEFRKTHPFTKTALKHGFKRMAGTPDGGADLMTRGGHNLLIDYKSQQWQHADASGRKLSGNNVEDLDRHLGHLKKGDFQRGKDAKDLKEYAKSKKEVKAGGPGSGRHPGFAENKAIAVKHGYKEKDGGFGSGTSFAHPNGENLVIYHGGGAQGGGGSIAPGQWVHEGKEYPATGGRPTLGKGHDGLDSYLQKYHSGVKAAGTTPGAHKGHETRGFKPLSRAARDVHAVLRETDAFHRPSPNVHTAEDQNGETHTISVNPTEGNWFHIRTGRGKSQVHMGDTAAELKAHLGKVFQQ